MQAEHCKLVHSLTKGFIVFQILGKLSQPPGLDRMLPNLLRDPAPVQLAYFFNAMSAQNLCHIQLHVYKHVHMPQ